MTHLLVDRRPASEDDVAAQQTSKEGVGRPLLAPIHPPLRNHHELVQRHELGEAHGMLCCHLQHIAKSRWPAIPAKKFSYHNDG